MNVFKILFQDGNSIKGNNRRRQRQPRRAADPWKRGQEGHGGQAPRQMCKAPRLDNQQLMELHKHDGVRSHRGHAGRSSGQRKSEFLDLWLDQLEETTRQMPHEALLQRVLELESELLQTQEKLKKATKDLRRDGQGSSGQMSRMSAPSSPLYCVSPRPNNSPLYCSPIYQSPRLISPSAE